MNKKQFKELEKAALGTEFTGKLLKQKELVDEYEIKLQNLRETIHDCRIYKEDLEKQVTGLKRKVKILEDVIQKNQAKITAEIHMESHLKFMDKIEKKIVAKENALQQRRDHLTEEELELQKKQRAIDAFRTRLNTSVYRPTAEREQIFSEQRNLMVFELAKYGTIPMACKRNRDITLPPQDWYIMRRLNPEFDADCELSERMFKEVYQAELIDRAMNGTDTPIYDRKGDYVNDAKIKNDKLAIDVAKALMPELYDRKNAPQLASDKVNKEAGTTINIISYNGATADDEFIRDIGVVKSVDDKGNISRITAEQEEQVAVEEVIIEIEPEADKQDK